ncbi:MAG: DUF3311 domain-containing protein [Verrucomicrobiales bacterium]|nr:DUF3311 domain-containing protein [Verrucomicrobiales bacterium]
MRTRTHLLLMLWVTVVYLLHQDVWNWSKVEPLVFGFLPIGLAYHVAYSLVASLTMYLLVRFAWPEFANTDDPKPPSTSAERHP